MTRQTVGWREWAGLPDLGARRIRAKIDTGAKTSAVHARKIEALDIDGAPHVSFLVEVMRDGASRLMRCCETLADTRVIRSSNGGEEKRFVIRTALRLGDFEQQVDLSLTDRGAMEFPLLVGRDALGGRFLVDPQASYLCDPEGL